MEKNLATASITAKHPDWTTDSLTTRTVHLGCGTFHRVHQALYTHQILEKTDYTGCNPRNSRGKSAVAGCGGYIYIRYHD